MQPSRAYIKVAQPLAATEDGSGTSLRQQGNNPLSHEVTTENVSETAEDGVRRAMAMLLVHGCASTTQDGRTMESRNTERSIWRTQPKGILYCA